MGSGLAAKDWLVRLGTGILIYLVGDWDNYLKIMLVVMCLDYISGICKGIVIGDLSSKKGMKGMFKKSAYLIALILAVMTDNLATETNLHMSIHFMGVMINFRKLIIFSVIGNEGISIVENLALIGFPVPRFFKAFFKSIADPNCDVDTNKKR